MNDRLQEFAADVGTTGPVTISGAGTRGGGVDDVRVVAAPVGINRIDAAEMVVECGAATPVDDLLAALAEEGQTVSVPPGGTIGGALAVGRSDITRLAHGPIRDVLLQTRYVSASGKLTKAGGPTVKNVSGFDLCRLFVGAFGSLGFFGDVILRTRPLPRSSQWFSSERDPFELLDSLYRPVSLLWDGATTWVRLDGDLGDVELAAEAHGLHAASGPPELPAGRVSIAPSTLPSWGAAPTTSFIAEVGVGVVHCASPAREWLGEHPPTDRRPDAAGINLHARIKAQFDPTGRLNPGVDPLAPTA